MSGFNVYPQPVATNRFTLKQNTAGQVLLSSLTSPTSVSTGSSDNTFGSWVQVTASTAVEYYITGVVASGPSSNSAVAAPLFVDIGMGGSGSETSLSLIPIGSSIGQYNTTQPRFAPGGHQLLDAPVRVAAGSRIAVRVALAAAGGSSQSCSVYVLAVPYAAVEGN